MKIEKLEFLWFEDENRRKVLRASVCTDCKLHIGEELRKNLPKRIRFGFDRSNLILAVTGCQSGGVSLPRSGMVNASALCRQFQQIGLRLPVVFEFEKDTATGLYLGHIVPQRQAKDTAQYDVEQLTLIYRPMIDGIINQLAKTTPKAERRAAAAAALCEAVEQYSGSQANLKAYVEDYLRRSLITENRKYTASYRDLHLDAPVRGSEGKPFTLHHILSDTQHGGIQQAENRIMARQFLNSLSEKERKLVRMMQEELKLPQIALELELTQEEVIEMGRTIGRKREAFYEE